MGLLLVPPSPVAQARTYLVSQSPFAVVDTSQPDRPEYVLRFDRRSASALVGTRFAGPVRDVESAGEVFVRFTLRGGAIRNFRGPPPSSFQPSPPIRGIFYFDWFPEGWDQEGIFPFSKYRPSLGWYDSGDPRVVRRQVDSILYAHLPVGIYDWWGVGSNQDYRFPTALAVARRTPLRWAILYEPEGYGDPSVDQIRSDLVHIRDRFASKPAYLKLDGRFVVYVYGNRPDDCSTVDRWRRANTVGAYLVMKAIGDNRSCPGQPDGWFQYSGNRYEHDLESDFFGICAGYEKTGVQVAPALPRISLDAWRQAIRDMVASGARNQLVVSFNEWGEASAVESALEWQTPSGYGAYLDALHEELPPIGSGSGR